MEQSQATMTATQPTMMGPQPGMMVMHQPVSIHRGTSHVIALLDMGFGVLKFMIYLLLCVAPILALPYLLTSIDREYVNKTVVEREERKETFKTSLYILIVTSTIGIFVTIIEILSACCLFSASKVTTSPTQALGIAKWWRGYHVFVIIFTFTTACLLCWAEGQRAFAYHNFICFVVHCVFIYFVHRYVQELSKVGGAPMATTGEENSVSMTYTSTQYQQNSWPSQYQQQAQ